MKVVIAGGTGSLGRALSDDLAERGHQIVVLTRSPHEGSPHREVRWDARTLGAWVHELEDAEEPVAVVNLAGKLVDCRPTRANIAQLRSSRVEATRALAAASAGLSRPVDVWVQGSTTAIWSDAGATPVTEDTPVPFPGLPQMTGVALPWEKAATGANAQRTVVLRTSLVMQTDTPLLNRLTGLVRAGAGGPVGTGRQGVSWIHVDDWLAVVRLALGVDDDGHEPLSGVLIASAPHPLSNADMMAEFRRVLHRPWAPPTPAPLVTVGSFLLGTDPALGLTGRWCTSRVLTDRGFTFAYPTLGEALDQLLD